MQRGAGAWGTAQTSGEEDERGSGCLLTAVFALVAFTFPRII